MSIWNSFELHMMDFTNAVRMRHLGGLFTIWAVYRILRALYNISPLHPLYQFPGPKLAAMTLVYEAWYDLIRGGRYTREIQRMHDKYGESTSNYDGHFHFSPDQLPSFVSLSLLLSRYATPYMPPES